MKQEERPPFVTFHRHAEEDRQASIEAGHYVAKDVLYAHVTPAGSKDKIEREVTSWFANLEREVRAGRFPEQWLQHYKQSFESFKLGEELPMTGSPLSDWPPISPAHLANCKQYHILTVEDLAAANEEALSRIGMGARALKQRAIAWLEASKTTGQSSEKIAALQVENTTLKTQLEESAQKTNELASQLEKVITRLAELEAAAPAAPPGKGAKPNESSGNS